MSLVALPPELRSICRKLTAAKVEQLPILLPTLLKDLQRCQSPLSEPHESKSSANSSEAAVLVHKLRTQIDTLLKGRSAEGHFVAVALIKTYVEVGGWETLQTSGSWVTGLVSILQKRGPMTTKELCIVTLTKIYALAQRYQTLVREIVSPSLPAFANACVQILKPTNSSKTAVKAPLSITESIFEAFSILIPLYPTTLRTCGGQLRSLARTYLAPTSSDGSLVPQTLQNSSRRLVTRLHMTAAKNGGADEWTKQFKDLIKEFHQTADQVFRAVQENWESTTGYARQPTSFDVEASGGDDSQEQLPSWTGIAAGSERMIGLLGCLVEYLRCATKTAVTIPVSALTDLTTRVSLIVPPTPGKDKNETAQMNPAAGREEKDDLWTVFPSIQVATLELMLVLMQRLGTSYTPLAQGTLDQVVRTIDSGYRLPEIRKIAFALVTLLLQLCGPTMSKTHVDALHLVSMICCRDLLGAAGHIKVPKQQRSSTQNGTKARITTQNADAFLKPNAEEESVSVTLDAEHLAFAGELLTALFRYLPQHHINPDLRSRMLRAAILCRIKDAEIASILHPARDRNGRTAQVILPYLQQQFPHDEAVEILRFNFRPVAGGSKGDVMDLDDEMEIETEEAPEKPSNGFVFDQPFQVSSSITTDIAAQNEPVVARTAPPAPAIAAEIQPSPFLPQPVMQTAAVPTVNPVAASTVPLKRKSEDPESLAASKRVDVTSVATPDPGFGVLGSLVEDTLAKVPAPVMKAEDKAEDKAEEDDSDNESIHLNMDLDSEGDEDE